MAVGVLLGPQNLKYIEAIGRGRTCCYRAQSLDGLDDIEENGRLQMLPVGLQLLIGWARGRRAIFVFRCHNVMPDESADADAAGRSSR